MSEPEAPKIEFPCDYMIKVMGHAQDGFTAYVIDTVRQHASGVDESRVQVSASRAGTYVSVSIWFEATGVEQLQTLNRVLREDRRVKMVL